MEENTVDTNTLRKKNMRVFWEGAVLAVIVSLITTWVALDRFVYNYALYGSQQGGFFVNNLYGNARGGGLNVAVALAFWFIVFILGVVFIQICLYIVVRVYTRRNKEISGNNSKRFTRQNSKGFADWTRWRKPSSICFNSK